MRWNLLLSSTNANNVKRFVIGRLNVMVGLYVYVMITHQDGPRVCSRLEGNPYLTL